MFKILCLCGAIFLWTLVGCQTARQRAVSLVESRARQLKPLSEYASTVCEVKAVPTQPALARFSQMYPGQVEKLRPEAWIFKWRQWESRCEVTTAKAAGKDPVIEAERGFLEAAFCLLGQVFYVNSPFDELRLDPEDVTIEGAQIRISPSGSADLGLFLARDEFVITTKTKSRGVFVARYGQVGGEWLPERMEHNLENLSIVLEPISYGERVGSRRMFKSLMLSVGTERPLNHSELLVDRCERL